MKLYCFVVFVIVSSSFVQPMSVGSNNATVTSAGNEDLGMSLHQYYMSDLCSGQINLNNRDAIIVSPWRNRYPPPTQTCYVWLTGAHLAYNFRFVITFKSMDLYGKTSYSCQRSRLDLFDRRSTLISDVNGLCGTNTDHESYETPSAYLKMQYATYNLPHSPQTFQAVITPFHYGTCSDDEFQCNNNKCIKNGMTCDSYDNCGDNSDEISCVIAGLTIAAIIGIVIGCIVFIAIIATCIICFCFCGWCAMFRYERI